jgi:hypothetical protein
VSLPDEELLRSGATGLPRYRNPAEELAKLQRQRGQLTLGATTLLAHDAAVAYRVVMGDRRERERAADSAQHRRRTSTHLQEPRRPCQAMTTAHAPREGWGHPLKALAQPAGLGPATAYVLGLRFCGRAFRG